MIHAITALGAGDTEIDCAEPREAAAQFDVAHSDPRPDWNSGSRQLECGRVNDRRMAAHRVRWAAANALCR